MLEFINLDTIATSIAYVGFLLFLLFSIFESRPQQKAINLLWAIVFVLAYITDKI